MRQWEESADRPERGSAGFRTGDHWYQTHKFAYELLAPVARARAVGRFAFPDVHKHFAHTNSAKCKDAAQGTNQGRSLLFKNCRQFIPGELVRLRPDVFVTQGALARDSLAGTFKVLQRGSMPSLQYHAALLEVDSRPVLRFEMSHPKARAGRYQREVREAWAWYMQVGHTFLLKGPAALKEELQFREA